MSVKDQIAQLLETHFGEYVSGSQAAQQLGVTRAAVWKGIQALESDGYKIEAVPNRGYKLSPDSDPISAPLIYESLGELRDIFTIDAYRSVDSTNLVLKRMAQNISQWHVAVSGTQTSGRGRMGRNFFSPADTGLYISLFLRPAMPAADAAMITSAAAVAVCNAIEECTTARPAIKWVNDVFIDGLKVCGILTEAAMDMESGSLEYAILGVGMNVYKPGGGFPPELQGIAGAILQKPSHNIRCALAASFLRNFYNIYRDLSKGSFVSEYRRRSFLIGQRIYVIKGGEKIPASAIDIDSECRLIVRYEDGRQDALSSGEVSVRPIQEERQ